jgi:hypothetical protein
MCPAATSPPAAAASPPWRHSHGGWPITRLAYQLSTSAPAGSASSGGQHATPLGDLLCHVNREMEAEKENIAEEKEEVPAAAAATMTMAAAHNLRRISYDLL